ncbi:hypothetical protein GM609_01415 [Bombella sp. ESL0387]|nr:hypothetical protein [Bombella sp. ESL0387]
MDKVKEKFARRARAQFRAHWQRRVVKSPTYQLGFAVGIAFSVAQQAKREHRLQKWELNELVAYLIEQVEGLIPPEMKNSAYCEIGQQG